jgi:hypothetical protein
MSLFDQLEAENSETIVTNDYPGNVVATSRTCKGNVEEGFAGSDVIVDTHYSTQFIEHAYIEPEAIVAVPEYESKKTDDLRIASEPLYGAGLRLPVAPAADGEGERRSKRIGRNVWRKTGKR